MAQSAKDYAKQQLGNLDLSYLKGEEDVANRTYDTTKSSLENNFNNLMNQIAANRQDTRKNFNTGRATVAENAYTANRQNQADLASRGVGSSGLKTLGEIGNRMETGQQYSNLANKFYSTMNDLDNTERQSRDQYNIDLETAKNTLDSALAGIASRRGEAQNQYNQNLGQLAEQVQGRWDANANARAALAQAKAAAAQAHSDAVRAARSQLSQVQKDQLANIVKGVDKSNPKSVDEARVAIQTVFQVDPSVATKVLQQLGLEPNKTFSFSVNEPYKPSTMNDLYDMLGIGR